MSTAREESSRYDAGSGAGGKFKKRPFRRTTQGTPYDRPPTAIRNPGNGNGNGWFSKLVDPAQRLIAYGANRLFASVFRKRLPAPPPPPQPPEPEETREDHPEAASTDRPARQEGALDKCDNPCNHPGGEYTELEHILKQKTFTRAETDRLTTLLRSRTFDNASGTEEKRSEVKLVALCDSKKEFPNTAVRENGTERHSISTPAVILNVTKVRNEDVASPAELAKAYMDGRPSKNSAPLLSLRSQAHREDSSELSGRLFPSKPRVMSLVPMSSGHVGGLGSGFVTPRSLGRSAIYNMARTPYSRANKTAALKSAGPTTNAVAGPSSSSWSQSAWEQSRLSVSRQVALKRRVDNDIGSVGPIRRIRQKSNLLSQKSLGLPVSESPLSIHEGGSGSVAQNSLSLIKKPFSSGEAKVTFTKTSTENGINSSPGTSFTPVPSKSSQMASKILQQLNELVSTREKSPTKFSPPMLSGLALKSLENVDSKFLENLKDKSKFDGATLPVIQDSTSHKQDKVEENGRTKLVAPPDKSVPLVNGIGTSNLFKANVPSANAADSLVMKSVVDVPQQKKQAFQMSAQDDYLDLDDYSDHLKGAASTSFKVAGEKLDSSVIGSQNTALEAIRAEKTATFTGIKPFPSSALNQTPNLGTYDGSMIAEQKASTNSAANLPTTSSQPVVLASQSTLMTDKPVSKESDAAFPMFNSGEKTAQTKEQNATVPTFSFGSAAVNKVQSDAETSGFKFDGCLDSKLRNSSSIESVATAANHMAKSAESDQADSKNTLKAGFFFSASETASSSAVPTTSSTGNIFKFSAVANNSNGSFASSPSPFSSQTQMLIPNKLVGQSMFSGPTNTISTIAACATAATAATGITATTSTISTTPQASVCSFTSPDNFKYASPLPSSNQFSTQIASSSETTESQTKDSNLATAPFAGTSAFSAVMNNTSNRSGGTSSAVMSNGTNPFSGLSSTTTKAASSIFGTSAPISSTSFGVTSSATPSTGTGIFSSASASTSMVGNVFGFSAPATTMSFTQSQSTNSFPVGNSQSSAAGSGVPTSTQSMPIQSPSLATSPSFGVAGNTTFSSGGSLFGLSASVLPTFGSGVTFGQSSSSSVSNAASTSSATASSLFGSSWPAPKTPIFGSTFSSTSSSTGFSFGASSTSIAGNASAPMVFGSSNIASSSSIFPFTSPAAATPSQPVFGSNTPGFEFGSAPTGNNEQMEDSMAEDTVQEATPAVPVFGQQPVTPPSSGFIFGATPPAGANPFQFGSQQNAAAQQNTSPFQPSGSLEFNAGGSFSLGSGGVDKSARKIVRVKSRQRKK
ncbi:hypothetical protein SLE2022_111740 [Rubroshorea leprosula]